LNRVVTVDDVNLKRVFDFLDIFVQLPEDAAYKCAGYRDLPARVIVRVFHIVLTFVNGFSLDGVILAGVG
jgi:hypothetical protein